MRRILQVSRINSSLASSWSLDASDVETRRIKYGSNDIIEIRTNRWLELALDTAKDPMIWFLVATSILFALLKNYNQAIILILATIPLIGMDAFLHWRTQVSMQSLSSHLAVKATVIRNGSEVTIPAWDIVSGDLVVIPTGMPIPADGIIIAGKELLVDESTLTGESFPVKKVILTQLQQGISEPSIDNVHWGFAGTRLLAGRALLRVVYTGRETLYGEIVTSALRSNQARTPLQKAITKLVISLIVAATVLCFVLAGVRYYQGFGLIDAMLSAATLAIAALPDEFPVVFTFFLGVGVYRLAKKRALVRRAVTVENIGRITYICSDKTGTITEGRFQLVQSVPAEKISHERVLYVSGAASRTESGDLLDLAIFDELNKKQIQIPNRVRTFPFTEDRKRESSILQINAHHYLIVTKGAPETVLSLSTLLESEKEKWREHINELAAKGYKIIACAQLISEFDALKEPSVNFEFIGLLAFTDPPRWGVAEAIETCRKSHIHVLMITGDHAETARAIACQIGLGGGTPKVVLAEDVKLSLLENKDYLRTIDVIARAIPSQKLSIVTTLQAAGEIVAVTGDGVNDVPALKAGDVGIAMGERGSESARESSDIVLLDDNFDTIVNAIAEGRQLFKNMQSSFKYLLIIHMPFVFTAAIIPLLGFPLLYYPIHIVFIELIIHPTAMLVFQDVPETKMLSDVEKSRKLKFFTRHDWINIACVGGFATLVMIASFIIVYHQNINSEHARALVLAELAFASAALTLGLSGFRSWTSRVIIVGTVMFSVFFIETPIMSKLLSLTPLDFINWLIVTLSSLIIFLLTKFL